MYVAFAIKIIVPTKIFLIMESHIRIYKMSWENYWGGSSTFHFLKIYWNPKKMVNLNKQ